MKLVIVETPHSGANPEKKKRYLHECMRDCLSRNEAPYASHMMYTQVLDDDIPSERLLGIRAGLRWGEVAAATIVYDDLGITQGMQRGIEDAERFGREIIFRSLPGWSQMTDER